jgi:hypothetical protein
VDERAPPREEEHAMPPDPPRFNGSGAPAAAITDLAARLDRIPVITPTHRRWAGLLGFLFVFDLVDLNSFAYAAPALRAEWGLSIGGVIGCGFGAAMLMQTGVAALYTYIAEVFPLHLRQPPARGHRTRGDR